MARILLVHQNFPGQFRHLAPALLASGHQVLCIGGPTAQALGNLPLHTYNPLPAAGIPACHPFVVDQQTKALRAFAAGELLASLLDDFGTPDLVIGHSGWGELLPVRALMADTPIWHQVEFTYCHRGADTGFDPEFPPSNWQDHVRLALRRSFQLLCLDELDVGVAPTWWQWSTVPVRYRDRVQVIHEGIDTTRIQPNPQASLQLKAAGLHLKAGDPVVTFVSRNLEPYRGIHRFMRMLPLLQRLNPDVRVVIVGEAGVSYGTPPPGGGTWKQALLQELGDQLDLTRIHFVGHVPHPVLHALFQLSACHVYLTYPFVLSWSLLEAMACGALVVGSATPPLQEVIRHGENGWLVDFFDTEGLAERIASVLADPQAQQALRLEARATAVQGYDLQSVCLPSQLSLVDCLLQGERPPAVVPPAALIPNLYGA